MAANKSAGTCAVSVVYALPDRHTLIELEVAAGTTLREAVIASGIAARHPEIDPAQVSLGVWGKLREADEAVRGGERIELYRALLVDPKVARARRVAKARAAGSAEGRRWTHRDSR